MNSTPPICALATPTGGALAIVRISGPEAIQTADKIVRKNLKELKPNTLAHTQLTDREKIVDDVIVSVYHAPNSYTGEDCVEITCHGSAYICQVILQLLVDNGCRMAKPGEYTQRAYLNGKLDLAQAEAVADLIASTNKATHQLAINQLRGNVSSRLAELRQQLLHLTSMLELELDFSDHEELEFADRSELLQLTCEIDKHIGQLAQSFLQGQAMKQGIPVAIVGKTNVGKSTLLNALLGDNRAIVSDIHGTTRDTIEECIDINGVSFRLIDTAGIRQTDDTVEQIGIDRTLQTIDKARIIVWMLDEAPTDEEVNRMKQRADGKELIIAQNKIDLQPAASATHPTQQSLSPALSSTQQSASSAQQSASPAQQQLSSALESSSSAQQQLSSALESSSSALESSSPAQQQLSPALESSSSAQQSASPAQQALSPALQSLSLTLQPAEMLSISAKKQINIEALRQAIYNAAHLPDQSENSVIITNARHYEVLCRAQQTTQRIIEGMQAGLTGDLLSEDLRQTLSILAEITGGQITTDEVLANIFSHFCIGK